MSQTTQLSELARALSRNRGTGMGIDPMLPAWKASVLRLSHGAPVLIRWFYLSIRCALHPESGTILWLGITVRISRTGEGLLLLRPYFRISTVRPLALKADCYITLAPWAGRGRLAVPARTKSQARLRNGDVSKSSFRRVPSGGATRN